MIPTSHRHPLLSCASSVVREFLPVSELLPDTQQICIFVEQFERRSAVLADRALWEDIEISEVKELFLQLINYIPKINVNGIYRTYRAFERLKTNFPGCTSGRVLGAIGEELCEDIRRLSPEVTIILVRRIEEVAFEMDHEQAVFFLTIFESSYYGERERECIDTAIRTIESRLPDLIVTMSYESIIIVFRVLCKTGFLGGAGEIALWTRANKISPLMKMSEINKIIDWIGISKLQNPHNSVITEFIDYLRLRVCSMAREMSPKEIHLALSGFRVCCNSYPLTVEDRTSLLNVLANSVLLSLPSMKPSEIVEISGGFYNFQKDRTEVVHRTMQEIAMTIILNANKLRDKDVLKVTPHFLAFEIGESVLIKVMEALAKQTLNIKEASFLPLFSLLNTFVKSHIRTRNVSRAIVFLINLLTQMNLKNLNEVRVLRIIELINHLAPADTSRPPIAAFRSKVMDTLTERQIIPVDIVSALTDCVKRGNLTEESQALQKFLAMRVTVEVNNFDTISIVTIAEALSSTRVRSKTIHTAMSTIANRIVKENFKLTFHVKSKLKAAFVAYSPRDIYIENALKYLENQSNHTYEHII